MHSWQCELLLALGTFLLVEVHSCAFHLDDLILECLNILHVFVELLL